MSSLGQTGIAEILAKMAAAPMTRRHVDPSERAYGASGGLRDHDGPLIAGDAAGATDALKLFASATAASLRQNPEAFRKAFDVLITQGKSGAIDAAKTADLLAQFRSLAGRAFADTQLTPRTKAK